MPLPLLFIALAAGTAALGVGKTVKAGVDIHDAKKTNEKANDIVDDAKSQLNVLRKGSKSSIQRLGRAKVDILNTSVKHFVQSFGQLKNVEFRGSKGLNELHKLCLDNADFRELKELSGFATNMVGGVAGGALGGALTAFGAYSAAGSLAAASTGTAIASLSGAAATNATLAFFGGGSLAAGGLGVAGGTAILGGLVAGPALAIMGFIVGAKASATKDDAYSNLAKAKQFASEAALAGDMCLAISKRCNLFVNKLNKLNSYFCPLIDKMDEAIKQHSADYSLFSEEQQNATAAAASLAKAIKMILDTPILNQDGSLTIESNQILQQINPDAISAGDAIPSTPKKQKELALPQIIYACESYVSSRFVDVDRELTIKYEFANFDWDKLSQMVRLSYGIDCTDEEWREYVPIFGEKTQVQINDVKYALEKFIRSYQISLIVEDCLKVESLTVNDDDMDWDLLLKAVTEMYGFKGAKWQLFHPGRNYASDIVCRIMELIDDSVKLLTESDFENTYDKIKRSYNRDRSH